MVMINSVMSVEPLRIYMRKKLKLKLKEKSQMAVLESVFWEHRTVREDTGGLSGVADSPGIIGGQSRSLKSDFINS